MRLSTSAGLALRPAAVALLACTLPGVAGCGKEGPPLPPLRLVPAPATELVARRTASEVELRFLLPTRNQSGPGPVDLERVEIYAITVAPGAPTPANRDLLTKERVVGTIAVQPAPVEGAPIKEDPSERRPAPGDRAVFVEELTEETLKPTAVKDTPAGAADPGQAAATAAAPGDPAAGAPAYPQRVYVLRGITRSGRPGPPSPRASVPLLDPPPLPTGIDVQFTERALVISWLPPVAEPDGSPLLFNVYATDAPATPLNATPVAGAAFEHEPVRFGVERCFSVRSLNVVQNVAIESAATEATCVTARDIFPPATPRGLRVIASADGISLSWDANTEPDLAGYIVLRGEAPGETLHPLTPEPIRDTNYRDAAVTPGVAYVYALVAQDKATPPNVSARSAPEVATAR